MSIEKYLNEIAIESATDKSYLKNMLKATIARSIFGNSGFYPIAYEDDKQIKKAVTLFPEAARIAKLK